MKAMGKQGRSKSGRVPPKPSTWLSAAGLEDWANWERVAPEAVLAATASLLAGTAGTAWLSLPGGPIKLPPLNIIIPDPCSREARAVVKLAEPVELLNQRLIDKMGAYSPAVLNQVDLGAPEGPTNRNPASASALARHQKALLPETDSEDLLGADLEIDGRQARLEAITRPAFLLTQPRSRETRTLVADCHRSTALAAPFQFPTVRHPAHTIRSAMELAELLDGRLCRGLESARVSAPGQLRLHAIFTPKQDAYARLPELAPQLLDRCLVVEPSVPTETANAVQPMAGRHRFIEAYRATLAGVLNTRRQGHDPTFAFMSLAASALFETGLRDFDQQCDLLPVEPGVSARGLPVSLCWALGTLARQLNPSCADETPMVQTVLTAAKHLLVRHVASCRELRAAEMVAEQLKLAERIATELKARGPLRLRALARLFHTQRMSRFVPVVAALEAAGVLKREGRWSVAPGSVAFEKVRQELEQRFLDAETLDTQEDVPAEGKVGKPTAMAKGKTPRKAPSSVVAADTADELESKSTRPQRVKSARSTSTSPIKSP